MKKLILILTLIGCLTSCKKSENENPEPQKSYLVKLTWMYTQSDYKWYSINGVLKDTVKTNTISFNANLNDTIVMGIYAYPIADITKIFIDVNNVNYANGLSNTPVNSDIIGLRIHKEY